MSVDKSNLNQDYIRSGQDVLLEEGKALLSTSEHLGEHFCSAIQVILNAKGKVVLTGLGKSGHVAKKISATLASTGTPSFFIHPSEALHGDLGMIDSKDVLIALAYGGETKEVIEVAKFCRRIGVPILTLTGNVESSLGEVSDIILDGKVVQEACPLNLAPTTSTTVAMGIGDALAVTLMKARGFDAESFAKFHPGGALGRKLSKVSDHLVTDLPSLDLEDGFDKVLHAITTYNYGISIVTDENDQIEGVITDGDLRRALLRKRGDVFELKVKDLMTRNPQTISKDSLAIEAISIMETRNITTLLVVNTSSQFQGIVRMYDLLAAKIV